MKKRREHVVPLSRQALRILGELRGLTGSGRLVFPAMGKRDRPLSENTATGALRRMGFAADKITAHDFRAMASTLLDDLDLIKTLANASRIRSDPPPKLSRR